MKYLFKRIRGIVIFYTNNYQYFANSEMVCAIFTLIISKGGKIFVIVPKINNLAIQI